MFGPRVSCLPFHAFRFPRSVLQPNSTNFDPKKIGEGLQLPRSQTPDARRQTPIKIKPDQTKSRQKKESATKMHESAAIHPSPKITSSARWLFRFSIFTLAFSIQPLAFSTAPPTKSDQIRPKNDGGRFRTPQIQDPRRQTPDPRPQLALPI